MPVKMPASMRNKIVQIAAEQGYDVVEKERDQDVYEKLITLESSKCLSSIKIDKVTGFSASGDMNYLKVAVHPDHYRDDLEDPGRGIHPAINKKSKKNCHSHSGYNGFPIEDGNNEPIAKAYRVENLPSLSRLLRDLNSGRRLQSKEHGDSPTPFESLAKEQQQDIKNHSLPEKGLIIDVPWIDLILSGQKTWEMRSRTCKIRGDIGLIQKGSGLVVGTARVVDVFGPLSSAELARAREKHCITTERKPDEDWMSIWNYAWVVTDARRFKDPIPYRHKSGSVIWVNLRETRNV